MKFNKIIAMLAALVMLMACMPAAMAEDVPTLVISTWPANIDIITKNVFEPFEAANNCKIVVETGNNSQRLAKLMENPEGYDIVYFSDYYVKEAIAADLFPLRLTRSKV